MSDLPALDPARIFPTYVGSNALSPFHACYANEKTVLRLAVGRFFAHHNGEDPVAGYWALRRHAALYDVPERPVEIAGPDAVPFLEHLIARPVADMGPGRGRYVLLLSHEGGLFMDGILFRLGPERFWFVQPDGDFDTWALAHRPGFDVALSDPHSRVLQLQGPKSFEIMRAASGGEIDETLRYFHAGVFRIGGQEVLVSRTGWTGELGYEIYTQGDQTDCPRLWDHLMAVGAPEGLVFGAMQSMNARRIEAGILDSGSDFDVSMTPDEAGLGRFVDPDKGDFIGRSALRSEQRGRRLFGLRTHGPVPRSGDAVLDGNRQVGVVTTGAYSPTLGAGIGYVRFDAAGQWPGQGLTLSTAGGEMPCDIVEPPFYDREKRLPRGLSLSDTVT